MRQEKDLLGIVEIETNLPYGAQTQRTINIYPTKNAKKLSDYPLFLQSILEVKKACAITNGINNELDPVYRDAIVAVIDDLLLNIEKIADKYFPIHAYHGGGGVGVNMSINEIVANLANQRYFQKEFGSYLPIHPNDHVNLNNSTSDVVKTAIYIAVLKAWKLLNQSIYNLTQNIKGFITQYGNEKKISRTCLQDAIEITFGDLFGGYLYSLLRHTTALEESIQELHQINIGGNIIGREGDCSELFFKKIIGELQSTTKIKTLIRTDNLFDASQNNDLLIRFTNELSQFSSTLIRISKDLRLMSSGPETGFTELFLPAVQQGSSAMPGKINPNIPEYMIQTAFHVIGICHSISITQMHDELDYSPWQTFIAMQLLDGINLLTDSIYTFSEHCIKNMRPNTAKNKKNLNTIIPTMVQLTKKVGYSEATNVYKKCKGNLEDIQHFLK